MHSGPFFNRFADHQEIGRDITDTHLSVFYDNGTDVGMWREERATTVGTGSVLMPDDAGMARYWFKRNRSVAVALENDKPGRRVWTPQPDDSPTTPASGRRR